MANHSDKSAPLPAAPRLARSGPLPTLGLLPILAVSAMVGGEAMAQEAGEAWGGEALGTILLEAEGLRGAAAEGYVTRESASDKLLTPLIDTPKSIKVITRKEMKERGQTTVEDILRSTPGITLGTGEGGNPAGLNPTIRGNTASNDVLIDGFRSPLRTSYESFNMETVEITKGPGGTLSGTGSTGGTINLTSKTPREGNFNDAGLSFGTGSYKRVTLDMNRSSGALGLRLNLMAQEADSLGGRKDRSSSRLGVAPSLSYQISDATRVTAGLYYFKDEDLLDYGVPLSNDQTVGAPFHRGSGTAADPYQPLDVPTDHFYGARNRDFHDGTTRSAFVRVEHDFATGLKLSSHLALTGSDNAYVVSLPRAISPTGVSRAGRGSNREGRGLSWNAQLSGESEIQGLNTRFALGVDLSRAKTRGYRVTSGGDLPTSILDPDPWTPFTGTVGFGPQNLETEVKTRGVYGFAVAEIAPQWEVSAGLRFDDFEADSWSLDSSDVLSTNANSASFWNGNIGLVYKPAENGSVYAALSTSANPGGEPNGVGSGVDSDLDTLDPERAYNYEIGTKWSLFSDQLFLSASVFRIEKNNARAPNAAGEIENIGKTRSQGFELDLAGQVTDQWALSAGYSYVDARVIDAGFNAGVPSENNGSRVAGVPLHSLSLWSSYNVSEALTLGGGATFLDARPLNAARSVALPSQLRVDLMASYAITPETSLQLNANNIFDEQLYAGSRGNGWANTEAGRNFTLTLNHSF